MKISLIYAYWPNQPGGVTWCDLPWALRDQGLPKKLDAAGHDVLETILMAEEPYADELPAGLRLAGEIGDAVREAVAQNELAIILAGSCALAAVGAIAGLGPDVGIAWFDAHPDLNTPETTTSGLFEGMALAAATGKAWRAMTGKEARLVHPARLERTVLFGARDIDAAEAALIREAGVASAADPSELARLVTPGDGLYVHLDMDVHDATDVRANAFAATGGPGTEQVRAALTALRNVKAMAVTGLDPAAPDAGRAAGLAIEHILAIAGAGES